MNARRWSCWAVAAWVAVYLPPVAVRGGDGAPAAKVSLAELKREYQAAIRPKFEARYRQAKSDAARKAIREESRNAVRSAFRRVHAWAEAHANDPEAIDALIWAAQDLGGYVAWYDDEITRTFELLTERAINSEKIAMVCYGADRVSYSSPAAKQFLLTMLEKSSSKSVRGASCLALGRHYALLASLSRKVHDPIFGKPLAAAHAATPRGFLQELEHSEPDALDRQAEAYFERVVAEFRDVQMPLPYFQTPFGKLASGDLFKLKYLSVGKVAPDIEGEDLSGRKFRLSEYRGKVVAIVFWASWCGPCMSNVPKERELVTRLAKKPFVLLGVNADDDRVTAMNKSVEEHMTWRSWWDGRTPGPIVLTWGIANWPTHYVLDTKGVIRYENPQGDVFYQAIDQLVAEAEAELK